MCYLHVSYFCIFKSKIDCFTCYIICELTAMCDIYGFYLLFCVIILKMVFRLFFYLFQKHIYRFKDLSKLLQRHTKKLVVTYLLYFFTACSWCAEGIDWEPTSPSFQEAGEPKPSRTICSQKPHESI